MSAVADAMSGTASCDALMFQGLCWPAAGPDSRAWSIADAPAGPIGCCTCEYSTPGVMVRCNPPVFKTEQGPAATRCFLGCCTCRYRDADGAMAYLPKGIG